MKKRQPRPPTKAAVAAAHKHKKNRKDMRVKIDVVCLDLRNAAAASEDKRRL